MEKSEQWTFMCNKHGPVKARISVMTGAIIPVCPECIEEEMKKDAVEARVRQIKEELWKAGIPSRFHNVTVKEFIANRKTDQDVVRCAIAHYCKHIDKNIQNGSNIVMLGRVGTGKTHLACAVLRHAIRSGFSAAYREFNVIMRDVKKSYETDEKPIALLENVDILCIDEIGASFNTDHERVILNELINHRYNRNRPTIAISNLSLPAFKELVGERVVDRLRSKQSLHLAFTWESAR